MPVRLADEREKDSVFDREHGKESAERDQEEQFRSNTAKKKWQMKSHVHSPVFPDPPFIILSVSNETDEEQVEAAAIARELLTYDQRSWANQL